MQIRIVKSESQIALQLVAYFYPIYQAIDQWHSKTRRIMIQYMESGGGNKDKIVIQINIDRRNI